MILHSSMLLFENSMQHLLFTTLLMVGILLPSHAQHTNLADIDSFILNQAERFHIPGIVACVVKGKEVVWSGAYGYADIEQERAMTVESVINIASISKTITATAIMQLWEQRQISLDADINDLLDFPVRNPNHPAIPITIRQLLTHTSSIADGPAVKIGFACGDPETSLKDWIKGYLTVDGVYYDSSANFHQAAPDSLREYSNVGFGLLGLIVEEVAGEPFNEYVRRQIFAPLGMTSTGYFLSEVAENKLATPYLYLGPLQKHLTDTEKQVLPYYNPYCHYSFWNYPDGLVRTTVPDLAKFATAMMHDGLYGDQRILKGSTIDKMMTPQLPEDINGDQDQGLCWFQSSSLYPTWYHGGSDPGVSTRMYVNKEDDLAVIVLQNANVDNTYYIIRELYDRFK